MPAWVWRDARSVFLIYVYQGCCAVAVDASVAVVETGELVECRKAV